MPYTFLIAADSFKDALPAEKVCKAIARGIQTALPQASIRLFPLADGGESLVEVLQFHLEGRIQEVPVRNPFGRPVLASYLLAEDGQTAFIEMAQAAGLQHLLPEERNALETSTFGVGEMIAHAMEQGARHILIGLGGSATNDAGIGMAAALGYGLLDAQGNTVEPTGKNLSKVAEISGAQAHPLIRQCRFTGLCDVRNPLFGPMGAAYVYGPQKGANEAQVIQLDEGLRHISPLMNALRHAQFKIFAHEEPLETVPGAGAAGGLGAGLMAFLNARLQPGIEAILQLTGFEKAVADADFVYTGEGRLDPQTLHGKLIHGITQAAAKNGKPVIAFCGAVEATEAQIQSLGLLAAFAIGRRPEPLPDALRHTEENLAFTANQVSRLL